MVDLQFNYPILPGQDEIFAEVLREVACDAAELMKLPPYGGVPEMREFAAKFLSEPGEAIPVSRVLLSAGGHNAVVSTMIAAELIGKKIACDPLTYNGFKMQAALMGCPLVACEGDEDGMLPDALERAAREDGVSAVYLMPTVHNPLGTIMPLARRLEIVEVARRHGVLIIDDDAYRFLAKDAPPHFATLAPDVGVFIESFTKPFAPGLKVAYFAFPEHLQERMIKSLRITSSGAPRVFCKAAESLIRSGKMDAIIEAKRKEGAERQRFARELLAGLPLRGYEAAYHFWLELPDQVSPDEITAAMEAQGILISSGTGCAVVGDPRYNGVRVALGAERDMGVLRAALAAIKNELAGQYLRA